MEIDQFERALKLGLGRALLFVNGPLAAPYSDVLLDACLHTKAHDPQIEGPRGRYLLDIINRTGNPSFYTDRILEVLPENAGHWDAEKYFEMARLLAQEGNARARRAMFASFEANVATTSVDDYAAEFMRLDGVDGLLFTLDRIGAWLRVADEPRVSDSLLRRANEILGEEVVAQAINERARTSANVATYIDMENASFARWAEKGSPKREPVHTYDQFRAQVASDEWPNWGEHFGPTELRLAALDLLQQTDPRKQRQYLRIFYKHTFPLDYDYLFQLTNSIVAPNALNVLSTIEDDRIRQFALGLVENRSPGRGQAVQLLTRNFRDGDHEMVKEWCENETDPEELDRYHIYLRDFIREHPHDAIEIALLKLFYDRQLCAHCRCDDVQRLIDLNALPDDLRAESRFDSYLETRELVVS